MKRRVVVALALFAGALAGGAARAQDPVLIQSQQGDGQFFLAPSAGSRPVFLESAPGGAAPVALGGTVNGRPMGNFGALPEIFPSNLHVDIGFDYLRPSFPSRAVTLAIPAGVNGNFVNLAASGNVGYEFGFVPTVTMDYQFPDLGFGVTASGEVTSLSGHINRTIDSAAGSASLTASATVNVGVANLLEGSLYLPLERYPMFDDCALHDTALLATLGTRYSHISQDYTASLNSGGSASTIAAHQDWNGFGLTSSLSFLHPLPRNFFLYGTSRGSLLLGVNNRVSTMTVVANGVGGSTATKVAEDKTTIIPSGEFEFGFAWGKPIGSRLPQDTVAGAEAVAARAGPVLWVKVGVVADVWGSLGLLSAPSGGFSDSALFLYGFTVQAGVDF